MNIKHLPSLIQKVYSRTGISRKKTIALAILLFLGTGAIATWVFASPGHDGPEPVANTAQGVMVRTVGDTDPDGLSLEGLSSFTGEVTSNDVASLHPSHEGVITALNVSIGQSVPAGHVIGSMTVTGIPPEQQAFLIEQEVNATRAELEVKGAESIIQNSADAFAKIKQRYADLRDIQNAAYGGTQNTNIAQQEVTNLARLAFIEIYPQIGEASSNFGPGTSTDSGGSSLFDKNTFLSTKYGLGIKRNDIQYPYQALLERYIEKIRNNSIKPGDIQEFLDKTTEILGESQAQTGTESRFLTQANITKAYTEINEYLEKLGDTSDRYRDLSLSNVELQKSLVDLENELALKELEQTNAQTSAHIDAEVAKIISQRLSVVAGGTVPIVAPRSGIVASLDKKVGDYVTLEDRVGYISTSNPRKQVRFSVPPSWKSLKAGDSISVSWRAEYQSEESTVTGVSNFLSESGTYQAETRLPDDSSFPIGAMVRIVPSASKKGVFVERAAVQLDGTATYVWVVNEASMIRKQNVVTGRTLGDYVEIVSGLERGFSYLVVNSDTVNLQTGMNISSLSSTSAPAASPGSKTIIDESQPHEH